LADTIGHPLRVPFFARTERQMPSMTTTARRAPISGRASQSLVQQVLDGIQSGLGAGLVLIGTRAAHSNAAYRCSVDLNGQATREGDDTGHAACARERQTSRFQQGVHPDERPPTISRAPSSGVGPGVPARGTIGRNHAQTLAPTQLACRQNRLGPQNALRAASAHSGS
jgi:hypothetical protein